MVRVLAGQGAREDVEELTADVFLALWAHAGELNPEQGLRPWLGTVARNRAADWLRTHKEAAPLPEDAAAPGGADPQAEAERREGAARLWVCLFYTNPCPRDGIPSREAASAFKKKIKTWFTATLLAHSGSAFSNNITRDHRKT